MRVRTATSRCDGCGLIREGELLHGSRCNRCEAGTFVNVSQIDESVRPWSSYDNERNEEPA